MSSLVTHQGLDGELAGADFKMSDKKAVKMLVKQMFPGLNHAQRRVKESEFRRILRK